MCSITTFASAEPIPAPPIAIPAAEPPPSVAAAPTGFAFASADGAFQVAIRGLLQADSRTFFQDAPAPDTFLLRRVRPFVDATVYRIADIRIMPDFGEGKAVLFDAYVDVHPNEALRLRVGKFKTPFGLERLQPAQHLVFAERGLPNDLVPNRDVGAQIYGEVVGRLGYAVGLFNGVVDGGSGDFDGTDSKEVAGRLFIHPWGTARRFKLGLGFATTYGRPHGTPTAPNLPSHKTPGQQTFFSYASNGMADGTTIADGRHYRYSPQLYAFVGPVGLLAEYVFSAQAVRRATRTGDIENDAWQVQLRWVVTGENATYTGVTPRGPLDTARHGWGALELAARYHQLRIDDEAFTGFADLARSPKQARGIGGAINWYINLNLRFGLDVDWTEFERGAVMGDREDEIVLITRLQAAF